MNTIEQFIVEFPACPFCSMPLMIEAQDARLQHDILVETGINSIQVNISSNYFINPATDTFRFSISISDENIISCSNTNQFMSLYDLDIILFKKCCKFYRSINITYDRSISKFSPKPHLEYFNFFHKGIDFSFANNPIDNVSHFTMIQNHNYTATILPIIPFNRFDFSSATSLYSKLNSILLLQ